MVRALDEFGFRNPHRLHRWYVLVPPPLITIYHTLMLAVQRRSRSASRLPSSTSPLRASTSPSPLSRLPVRLRNRCMSCTILGPWSRRHRINLVLRMLTSAVPSVGPHEKLTLIRIITRTSDITDYGQVSRPSTSHFSYRYKCSRNVVRTLDSRLEAGSEVSERPASYQNKINLLNAPSSTADGNK